MGNTIPGQVVLDCVRNLAAHEPESQAESKPAYSARPWLLILVPSVMGLRAGNANQINLFSPSCF